MSSSINGLGLAAQNLTPLPNSDPPVAPGQRVFGKAMLGDTVSLAPPSAVNAAYENLVTNSQTSPGSNSERHFSIHLSHEPLVGIEEFGIAGRSYYAIDDGSNVPYGRALPGARREILVRRSVARRLQAADAMLRPYGYRLYVMDGWRDPKTQHAIFATFMQRYRDAHPGVSVEEARAHALRYASDPQFDPQNPVTVPLHTSGGAVDVTLMPVTGSSPLDLGTPFDDTSPRAHTAYFETHAPLTPQDAQAKTLRETLNAAMLRSGFTNYPKEWWHFDFGDRMYAAYSDMLHVPIPADVPAYGYIEPTMQ